MPITVWVATAPIYLGTGSSFVRAYNTGEIVPDSVVTDFGLETSGLVATATIEDDGTSPNWRGTDPITRDELDAAIAEALAGGASVVSVNGETGAVVLTATDVGAADAGHTHADLTAATDAATGGTLVRRTAGGGFTGSTIRATAAPVDPSDLTRKDYTDAGDTAAKARANHTGTQAAATISDLTEVVQDIVGALIVAGTNTTVSYNDAAGTFTINATASGGTTDPEIVRDTIGGALVAGSGISITVNDAGDTITVASTAVLPTRQVISGTGLSGGGDLSADRTLAVSYGSTAGTAVQGNDARVTADQAAATASIRTLGTGAQQAAAGNHTHSGLTADQAAGTASIRTLGTGATQAAAGNHTHTAAAVGAVEAVTAGLKARVMTQAAYDALGTKDATTLYIIQG